MLFRIFSLSLGDCVGLVAMPSILHYSTFSEWAQILQIFPQTSAERWLLHLLWNTK